MQAGIYEVRYKLRDTHEHWFDAGILFESPEKAIAFIRANDMPYEYECVKIIDMWGTYAEWFQGRDVS